MIESVSFQNFKVLQDATLSLGRFTLLIGPNGSGKSTVFKAFEVLRNYGSYNFANLLTARLSVKKPDRVEIVLGWSPPYTGRRTIARWLSTGSSEIGHKISGQPTSSGEEDALTNLMRAIRIYSLDASQIASPANLTPSMELSPRGDCLAGVLDQLRDRNPERFEMLNEELGRLVPEFDRILFETPSAGARAFLLRTRDGQYRIKAVDLSQGTILALAILTLAYLPDPPPLVCLEEPDRGIHPRLLRDLRDALYRLSYPESFGEKRAPVQVVATTHSPYFLDLFRDHREEIVIAQKEGLDARFGRLVDRPDIEEILGEAPLGEVWYSGVLGGVPSKQ